MGVNSLPKTVTRQCRDCDLNLGPSAPESSTLPSHPCYKLQSGLCIELWDSFDACDVSSCGIWAGRRPPLGSSQAERSVISEVKRVIINNIISAIMNAIGQRRRIFLLWCSSTVYTVIFFVVIKCTVL